MFSLGIERLNTRFPGCVCLPCYFWDKQINVSILFIIFFLNIKINVPFPHATIIPVGPLKFSIHPGMGSFILDTTVIKNIFLFKNIFISLIYFFQITEKYSGKIKYSLLCFPNKFKTLCLVVELKFL